MCNGEKKGVYYLYFKADASGAGLKTDMTQIPGASESCGWGGLCGGNQVI